MADEFKTKDDVVDWWIRAAKADPNREFHLRNAWGEPNSEQKAELFVAMEKLDYLERLSTAEERIYILSERGKDYIKTAQAQ